MVTLRVCAAHIGGFGVPNALKKGPFFGKFSLNMDGLSREMGEKMSKMGSFPPKFVLNVGMTATVRNWKRVG